MKPTLQTALEEIKRNYCQEKNNIYKAKHRFDKEKDELERIIVITNREIEFLDSNKGMSNAELIGEYDVMINILYKDYNASRKEYIKHRGGIYDRETECFIFDEADIKKYLKEYSIKVREFVYRYRNSFNQTINSGMDREVYQNHLKNYRERLQNSITNILQDCYVYEMELAKVTEQYQKTVDSIISGYVEIMIENYDYGLYKIMVEYKPSLVVDMQNRFIEAVKHGNLDLMRRLIYFDVELDNMICHAVVSTNIEVIDFIEMRLDYQEVKKQWREVRAEVAVTIIWNQLLEKLSNAVTVDLLGLWYQQNANSKWCKVYDDYCLEKTGCKEFMYVDWRDRQHIFKKGSLRTNFNSLYSVEKGEIEKNSGKLYAPPIAVHNEAVDMINSKITELLDKIKVMTRG